MNKYTNEALGAIVEHLETTAIETGTKVDNLNIVMSRFETTLIMNEKAKAVRDTENDKKLDTIYRMVDGITKNTASRKDIDDHEIRIRKIEINDMAEVAKKSDVKGLHDRVSKIENADAVKWKNAMWAIGLIIAGFILNEGKAFILNLYDQKQVTAPQVKAVNP